MLNPVAFGLFLAGYFNLSKLIHYDIFMLRPPGQNLAEKDIRLAGLDHLRALAITLVFLFHYRLFAHPAWLDTAGSFGWTGVDLFFVLSGYLIAGQLFRQVAVYNTIDIRSFFVKRFFRIIPAYLVVLALYFFVPAFREREALSPSWKFLTFTQNFGLDLGKYGTFSHAWSLCIEEQFYFLLPFLVMGVLSLKWGKKAALLLGGLFIAGFLFRLISWYQFVEPHSETGSFGLAWYQWIYYPTYNRLDGLITGVSIAGICQFFPRMRIFIFSNGNALLISGIVLITAACFLCADPYTFKASIFGFPLVAIAYGCILAAVISPSCFIFRFKLKSTAAIAALSYAVYLTHKGIIHITQVQLGKLGIEKDGNFMFVLCIITVLAGALLLRILIEKPFIKMKAGILDNRKNINKKLQPGKLPLRSLNARS